MQPSEKRNKYTVVFKNESGDYAFEQVRAEDTGLAKVIAKIKYARRYQLPEDEMELHDFQIWPGHILPLVFPG